MPAPFGKEIEGIAAATKMPVGKKKWKYMLYLIMFMSCAKYKLFIWNVKHKGTHAIYKIFKQYHETKV